MKVTLEFTLPEEREEYEVSMNGSKAMAALFDIHQELFRPVYKHGYQDARLSGRDETIEILAAMFFDILKRHDLQI